MVNQDPDEVRVDVIDTGIGIEPRSLTEVFNRFMQINRPAAPEGAQGGLGLGLAISKSIIDAHEGEITASSLGLDRGATLSVVLKTTTKRPEGVSAGSDGASSVSEEPLRILLVEDHQDTRDALRRLLIRKGYEVETAEDVTSALELAGRQEFDLLVSDIGLPDGSGVELMLELKKRKPLPGIALSGFGMQQDVERSREAGFIEHLTKPVSFSELQAVIAKHRAGLREAREQQGGDEMEPAKADEAELPSAVNGTGTPQKSGEAKS
jgi:CheY-like chemotaxis protein